MYLEEDMYTKSNKTKSIIKWTLFQNVKLKLFFYIHFTKTKSISPLSLTAHRHSRYSCRESSTTASGGPPPFERRYTSYLTTYQGINIIFSATALFYRPQDAVVLVAPSLYLRHRDDRLRTQKLITLPLKNSAFAWSKCRVFICAFYRDALLCVL